METKEGQSNLKQCISRFMTIRNQCMIVLFTLVVASVAIYAAVTDSFPDPVRITLYAFAAEGFVCSCILLVKAISFFVKAVLLPFTKRNQIASTLIIDTRLRTVLFTVPGMGFNLIYAVFQGIMGITNHSAWCGSLSAYYLLLCVMRFLSVSYAREVYDGNFPWKKEQRTDG